ncbi:arylesterase [Thiomicrorhabdus sp.]|uniref:arylesterase n=1 Tax=Thiomicrorhabdus sp. TaxID=2039724 RepID=UPI002AA6ECC6|nr:arylesterase [Thiomicrorhabdus sp.]
MHILQFNHIFKLIIHAAGIHLSKALLLLLLSFSLIFHPSLSVAQSQGEMTAENMKQDESNRPGKLLVMGDSLSAAYGIEINQGWVALLQKKYPQIDVVNASISGETTSGGKQRLQALLEKYQPDIMVLELGANDALRGQDLNVTKRNLQSMIDACLKFNKDCKVVLLGVQLPTNYGPLYDQMFQKMYRDLAEKNNLLFDPFFIEPVALDPGLMQQDGLHPNAEGQPLILQRIAPLLEKILTK